MNEVEQLLQDIFGKPKPKGSAQCPKCGRFSKIVRFVYDASPLSAEEGGYVVVNCKQHGEGIS